MTGRCLRAKPFKGDSNVANVNGRGVSLGWYIGIYIYIYRYKYIFMYMHVYNGRGVSWTLHVAGSYDRKSIYLTLLLPHTHTVH